MTWFVLAILAADSSVVLGDVPFVQQRPDFCGEAVAAMALQRLGRHVTQDDVFNASRLDPAKGRGVWTNELATALRALGVDPGPTWFRIDPAKATAQVTTQWNAIVEDLRAGQPTIVCMHFDDTPKTTEHFRLITGYDAKTDEVVYQEPAEANGAARRMKREAFLALWPFKPAGDHWSLIRLRITPAAQLAVTQAPAAAPSAADVSQHVQALKATLPPGMTVLWEKPFLVVGDEAPSVVRTRSTSLVKWTRDLLLKDFFDEAPDHLEEIWVLKDATSYEKLSRSLFATEPDTPYGYYLPSRHALIMNIRPGGGTLVHEMVHPFMHHAWPEAPGWLNEGLASLFEFPYEEEGHLKGRVNWRLPGLKAGLAAKVVPTFAQLTALDTNAFYDDPHGVHYGAARYLCLWLQEKGLLVKVVRRAIELKAVDPTGLRALTEALGHAPDDDRAAWETWVRALSQKRS
jgi:Peptidase_C39 like family